EKWEVLHHRLRIVVAQAADRPCGAGQQRPQGLSSLDGGNRLGADIGGVGRLTKNRRSDLATRIAVDAAGIHEEIAGDVFWHSLVRVRHDRASVLSLGILRLREAQELRRSKHKSGETIPDPIRASLSEEFSHNINKRPSCSELPSSE